MSYEYNLLFLTVGDKQMKFAVGTAIALFALAVCPAFSQTPAFDPRTWHGQHVGRATEVLTIGSPHLGQMPDGIRITSDMLDPLIARLAAFKPDIITHEGRSGEQCEQLRQYKARYPDMWSSYCFGTDDAELATGLNVSEAMAMAEKTLKEWPAQPSAAQRRRLASLFLAAGDRPSASVQWLQLPIAERKTGDGINDALIKIVTRVGAKPNEVYDVAVRLAAQLGLQRVHAVDDHTADSIQGAAGPGFDPALQKIWSSSKFAEVGENDNRMKAIKDGAGLLDYYRFLNVPRIQRAFIKGDYHVAMNTASPELYGRQYVAWWETRNLRMVANIRAAFGNRPGARVLNIVGASHKPYYDAYLDMMSDVKLVDAEAVLK